MNYEFNKVQSYKKKLISKHLFIYFFLQDLLFWLFT